jgi:hypothetical protein
MGFSITSTVSTTAATGCFIRRTAFFAVRLGFALATVRFGATLDTLRALLRLAEFLRSFRFCTFDRFLRLAMIASMVWFVTATH